jgi:hypothetical protein
MCIILICFYKKLSSLHIDIFYTWPFSYISRRKKKSCFTADPFLANGAEGPEPKGDIDRAYGIFVPCDGDPRPAYCGDIPGRFYFS